MKFKDYFSEGSAAYNTFRPQYPDELFSYLSSVSKQHKHAWDCATGNGQSAVVLAKYFEKVTATDASENQIENAIENPAVRYRVEAAEKTSFENESVDLITVAQALHWFNHEAFANEVDRVLKPRGVLAVWSYGMLKVSPEIDEAVQYLYEDILGAYWPPERRLVEQGYKNIDFPFSKVKTPEFEMKKEWDLVQLCGYLSTWSALKQYKKNESMALVEKQFNQLSSAWGSADKKHPIEWPLTLKVWIKE